MRPAEIEKVLRKIEDVPPIPLVIQKLLDVVADPKSSAPRLADVISTDQALAAKTLKLVNSAYYGFERKIPSISRAVVVLGFHTIRKLALSLGMMKMFKGKKNTPNFDRQHFWEHSLSTATCASMIAERSGQVAIEDIFLAGLIHDLGRLVLDVYFQEQFSEAVALAQNGNLSLRFAEDKILETNHGKLGAWVAELWNFPDAIVRSIRFHHNAMLARRERDPFVLKTVAIIQVANIYSKVHDETYPTFSTLNDIEEDVWKLIPFSQERLLEMQDDIADEIEKSKLFLGIFNDDNDN